MREALQKVLNKHDGAKFYFTGFGVGGALATFGSLEVKKLVGHADMLYTFGQPRVGNEAFADEVKTSVPERYRVICYADIVPQLPPQTPVAYSHFSFEIWYDEGMTKYKQCGAEEYSCSKSLFPWKWSTNDHNPSKYEKLASVS